MHNGLARDCLGYQTEDMRHRMRKSQASQLSTHVQTCPSGATRVRSPSGATRIRSPHSISKIPGPERSYPHLEPGTRVPSHPNSFCLSEAMRKARRRYRTLESPIEPLPTNMPTKCGSERYLHPTMQAVGERRAGALARGNALPADGAITHKLRERRNVWIGL